MNPFRNVSGLFRNQHEAPRAGRRLLGKRLALEALEGRSMMAGDAQLDAAPEAVAVLNDSIDTGSGQTDLVCTARDDNSIAVSCGIRIHRVPDDVFWRFSHRDVEIDHSMTFYRHDLPDQYIPQGGTPFWSLETPDGRSMLDNTWYRLPSGDFVSKGMSADLDSDGESDGFSYRYANMHDYGPGKGNVWICGGFYSRVSHTAIYDWNEDGPLIETYAPPVDTDASPVVCPAGPTVDIPQSIDTANVPRIDAPSNDPITQCYASPDLWQKVWSDAGSSTDTSSNDAPQPSPRDEVVDFPVVSDPIADTREDGWQDEVLTEKDSATTEPVDGTFAEDIVNEFGDA